ncbi:uncharacterized protein Tco025E_09931, partial [Trypanosoma conorhini]
TEERFPSPEVPVGLRTAAVPPRSVEEPAAESVLQPARKREFSVHLPSGYPAEEAPTAMSAVMTLPSEEEPVVTRHRARFDGDDWDLVLERKRAALCEAFDADVCGAVGVPRGSVVDVDFALGSLTVEFGLRHAPSFTESDVAKRLAECDFLRTWKLYEPRKQPGSVPAVVRLAAQEEMLPVLRTAEVCGASPLKLQSSYAVLPTLRVTEECFPSPEVPVGLRTAAFPLELIEGAPTAGSEKKDEVKSVRRAELRVDPNVGEKYRRSLRLGEPPQLFASYRVGFVGDDWKFVVDKYLVRLKDCFWRDVLDIGGVVPRSVEGVSCSPTGDVVVTVLLEHAASLSQEDVLRLLDEAPFLTMWQLHDDCAFRDRGGRTKTFHRVGFLGSDWTSRIQGDAVAAAFVRDLVEVLDVRPEDVRVAALHISENLVVDFYVEHSASISEARVDEVLRDAPFDHVWEVYKTERTPVLRALKPLRVPVRPAAPRKHHLRTLGADVGRPYRPSHLSKMPSYPRPGLRYRKPTTEQERQTGTPEELFYVPQEKPVPTWDQGIELPRVAPTTRNIRWPLRTDFNTARQERRVNLSEVNEVLGMQRGQRLQPLPQPQSGDSPNTGLLPLYHEMGAMRRDDTRDPLRPYRKKLRRLRFD